MTTPTTTDEEIKKLREHNAWLEAELKRYQDAGCLAVAERLRNQWDRIGVLQKAVDEAVGKLQEALHA